MKFEFQPYPLRLKHTFTVAGSSRTETPDVLVSLTHEGVTGYGEASMPPYLGESMETVCAFLSKLDLGQFTDPFRTQEILDYVMHADTPSDHNFAAKAAVDIALHDLQGRLLGHPLWRLWGLSAEQCTYTTYTIGIDTPDMVRRKVHEVEGLYGRLKVKVGVKGDRQLIDAIRSVSRLPITVDANQGWQDRSRALDQIFELKERGVIMVEQPLAKNHLKDLAWLTERSPLPILLDESVQGLSDISRLQGCCHGINIKLMKCGGLNEARKMIFMAKHLGMQVMLGCMTETTCAVTAAAQLAPEADFLDLDGNLLISNDPFTGGMQVIKGLVTLNTAAGLGIQPTNIHPLSSSSL